MTIMFWLVVVVFAAVLVGLVWYIRRKAEERRFAEEARVAAFVSRLGAAVPPSAPSPATAQPLSSLSNDIAQQKLLFESAYKAGEADEPALAIQLYARLLARYPATTFADPAREAVEAQKKKLPKAR
ncbi:MAG: hypothetical protein EXR33_04155 [Betaproteobacteria bacterium]|nr:hypothetical protein [Betaproteobacteria bacterium]